MLNIIPPSMSLYKSFLIISYDMMLWNVSAAAVRATKKSVGNISPWKLNSDESKWSNRGISKKKPRINPLRYWSSVSVTLLLLGLHSLRAENTKNSGVAIFDTLYIQSKSSFIMEGNLYLHGANVMGGGALRMQGKSSHKIVSDHSQIEHFSVATSGEVTLKGDLAIIKSLTLDGGRLNTGDATLQITDTTRLRLLNGAKLVSSLRFAPAHPLTDKPTTFSGFRSEALLPADNAVDKNFKTRLYVYYKPVKQFLPSVILKIEPPPPRCIRNSIG